MFGFVNQKITQHVITKHVRICRIAFTSEEEAHYVCAILNSALVRFCVRSYSSAGRGFGAPSVVKYFGIPKYEKEDKGHLRLSELSKRAQGLARMYYEGKELGAGEKLNVVEVEVDEAVAGLCGITGDELEVVKKTLGVWAERMLSASFIYLRLSCS